MPPWPETPADRAKRKAEHPRKRRPCTCNGMAFICNRWVFIGECRCNR